MERTDFCRLSLKSAHTHSHGDISLTPECQSVRCVYRAGSWAGAPRSDFSFFNINCVHSECVFQELRLQEKPV